MKTIPHFLSLGGGLAVVCIALSLCADQADAQVLYLNRQHMDLLIRFDSAAGSNRLDVVLKHDLAGVDPIATNQQVYIVRSNNIAPITIPSNPDFAFLGSPGAPVWTLPKSQDFNRPFVGVSAEDFPDGVFDSPLTFQLMSVEGPGNFFVWDVPGPSQPPIVKMIWTNGVLSPVFDGLAVEVGSHSHYNWGFSTNGLYRVTFRAAGTMSGGGENVVGKDVAWAFQLLPLRPWEQWVSTNWLPATPLNIAGPGADTDNDGIVNIMEYALGLDPNVFSTNGLPSFSFVTNGADVHGALTFTRVKTATDLNYEPAARSELTGGDWQMLTNVVSMIDNGNTETVTVRDGAPMSTATNRFYQLRVTLHYP